MCSQDQVGWTEKPFRWPSTNRMTILLWGVPSKCFLVYREMTVGFEES